MTLANPSVVETLDFETILDDIKARIVALMPAAAPVIELESEPLNILAQSFAYRELLIRARVNDAAAAQYIETASGTDLDHKADFYGLTRMPGETDERRRDTRPSGTFAQDPGRQEHDDDRRERNVHRRAGLAACMTRRRDAACTGSSRHCPRPGGPPPSRRGNTRNTPSRRACCTSG